MRVRDILVGGSLILSTACATSVDFKRPQSPIYTVKASAPGVAVVDINTSNIDNNCGGAEGNIAETLKSSIREYITSQQPAFQFADETKAGVKADFNVEFTGGLVKTPTAVAKLSPVPESVTSPLVSAIYVMKLECKTAQDMQNKTVARVEVVYAFSTWTKSGQLVATEIVSSEATGGDIGNPKVSQSQGDNYRWEAFANRVGRRPAKERLPAGAGELIAITTKDAVSYHYFPFFTQSIEESYGLRDDGALKAGADLAKAGKFDEALAAWEQIVATDAKNHGAYFDIAVASLAKGDDEKASAAIEKAVAIEDVLKYRMLRDAVKGRLALHKTLE